MGWYELRRGVSPVQENTLGGAVADESLLDYQVLNVLQAHVVNHLRVVRIRSHESVVIEPTIVRDARTVRCHNYRTALPVFDEPATGRSDRVEPGLCECF